MEKEEEETEAGGENELQEYREEEEGKEKEEIWEGEEEGEEGEGERREGRFPASPVLLGGFFTAEPPEKPQSGPSLASVPLGLPSSELWTPLMTPLRGC